MTDPDYYRKHAVCPACGSRDLEETTMGCLGDRDTNRCRCVCGWRGVVDDLVPQRREGDRNG